MIPIRLRGPASPAHRRGEPVTFGPPLPAGWLPEGSSLAVWGSNGQPLRGEFVVCDQWRDGSAKWVLTHARLDIPSGAAPGAVVGTLAQAGSTTASRPIAVAVNRIVTANLGQTRAEFGLDGLAGFRARWAGQQLTASVRVRYQGRAIAASVDRVEIEHASALRASILLHATVTLHARRHLEIDVDVECYADLDVVRVRVTLRNPGRARHSGGFWPLGDPGAVLIDAFEFGLSSDDPPTASEIRLSGHGVIPFDRPALLHQDSSGGTNWTSPVHRNREGLVKACFPGFRLDSGDTLLTGQRAVPVANVRIGNSEFSAAVPQFWQNCPQSIRIDDRHLVLGFLPREHDDRHELQGGEQKTFETVIRFGPETVSDTPLAWVHEPIVVSADPSWYAQSGAVARLSAFQEEPAPGYNTLTSRAIEGSDSIFAKREQIDEYGWRHFGDVYADHEAVHHVGPLPLVSHYNNQYDALLGFGVHFLRSGDPRWWELFHDLARHVADIDIYHTSQDKAAYSGGLFWHTNHHTDAGIATHRTYDPRAGVGGGPSAEHNYAAGLALHYRLTGSRISRDAATGLARWVIRMDEGHRTPFRWLASGPTGLASASGSPLYHGPGRAAANSIVACLQGHRLSADPSLLAKAEELIRRCIHPSDDVPARQLFEVEKRWYYTVFLQALGEYLDYKQELGESDRMCAWARESLLTYGRWMASHERPYLTAPDLLEFPNETWVAQDLRKAEVLAYAACYASGAERAAFLARAKYFYNYSCSTLLQTPRAVLTRPLVLTLVNGWRGASLLADADIERPAPPPTDWQFKRPEAFEPQKVTALRRAKWVSVAAAALTAGAALWFL